MPSTVFASMPRNRRRWPPRGSGSRFCSIQARASCRKVSTSIVSVLIVAPSSRSQSGQLADPLPVPRRVAVQGRVGRQPPQVEVLLVLPRVADAAEHLEAVLGQLDAAVPDE